MRKQATFEGRLSDKLREQIKGRRAGFLLGAGASFLEGSGYPLALGLWPAIRNQMSADDQRLVEDQMSQGISTLEQALDAIDRGQDDDFAIRHRVTSVIATAFRDRTPPLQCHMELMTRLAARNERRVPVFTLNYDSLIELAADHEQRCLIDGFSGCIEGYFDPAAFSDYRGRYETRRGKTVSVPLRGVINLYKLHGSLGWYVDQQRSTLKRIRPDMACPSGWRHLMLPPQNRKAADTGMTPYATLWSEFRAYLANDSARLLNRLVCVGYGMRDGHVNAIIRSALARSHFTLVVLAKALADEVFEQWRAYPNVLIATETRSSLYGEEGPGIEDAWAFEWLAKEV